MAFNFQQLNDPQGSVIFGWVGIRVLYARFDKTISADLGQRFALGFSLMIGDAVAVHYFSDSSSVAGYDLAAYAAIADSQLAKRPQFKRIVARPWTGPMGQNATLFARALGCVEYMTGRSFDLCLEAAAPCASEHIHQFTANVRRTGSNASHGAGASNVLAERPPEPSISAWGHPISFDRRR